MDMFTHVEITAVLQEFDADFQPFMLADFGSEHLALPGEDKIYFDRIDRDNRISVFASPRIPGKARTKKGFSVESYAPGYIKDADNILPNHVFTRRPGEQYNKKLSPSQHYAATLVDLAAKQIERLRRTQNIMASQLLLTGGYTMKGDGIDMTLSFGRAAGNTITLAGTARWLDANTLIASPTADPWEDLQTWLNLSILPTRVIKMGNAAWRALRKSPRYKEMVNLEIYQAPGQKDVLPGYQKATHTLMGGVTFRGVMYGTGIPIYTYTDTYTAEDGTETLYLPTDAVVLVPESAYGVQAYASIQDASAEYEAMPYYIKNWLPEDPSIPMVMLQSAPLLAHTKINSTVGVRTGATATGA